MPAESDPTNQAAKLEYPSPRQASCSADDEVRPEFSGMFHRGKEVAGAEHPHSTGAGGLAGPVSGFLFFLFVVVFFSVTSLLVVKKIDLPRLMLVHLFCVLLPSLLFVRLTRVPAAEMLSIRRPSWGQVSASALLGAGTWLILGLTVVAAQNELFPPSEAFEKMREELFMSSEGFLGGLELWAAAALTPAITEEVLFRGVLLQSFRQRLSDRASILLVSTMFAMFHFNPYQLLVTFLLGCLLGWILVRTGSLVCAMVFHLVNNSVVLAVARVGGGDEVSWHYAWLALMAVAGFVWLQRAHIDSDIIGQMRRQTKMSARGGVPDDASQKNRC